ncbi:MULTISPECIES: hypothetical protein [unclassified Streptomyces]|uniref:hypothetical protein n=1 Tax=unclassified Streptomyces TaxID=2593676 RepID=UPI0040415AEC
MTHTFWASPPPDGPEPSAAAATDGDKARLVLPSSLAEPDAPPGRDSPTAHGSGGPGSGDPGSWHPPRNDPPGALIRLRFADASALEHACAAFRAGSGPGLGDAWSDPATLSLRIPGDAGVETLRNVLAVLDAAAITPESLTVHTHELDDVVAAFTGLT